METLKNSSKFPKENIQTNRGPDPYLHVRGSMAIIPQDPYTPQNLGKYAETLKNSSKLQKENNQTDRGPDPYLHVRGGMAMIPQDPFMFSGTVRLNIDLFGQYTEPQIALKSLK